jgi:predicted NodU family carbamoyl transferase
LQAGARVQRILGLSAYYHDAAAALVVDGRVVVAAQEERFTRRRHDAGFPANAARYCLERAGVGIDGLDAVFFGILLPLGRVLRSRDRLQYRTGFDPGTATYRVDLRRDQATRLEEPF